MKKYLVFENQFEDFCNHFKNKGFINPYPEKLPTEWPCLVLVEEYYNPYGNDEVLFHYVYESDFNFYEKDVD